MKDYDLMKKLYSNIENKIIYTLTMRFITLLLIAMILTPIILFFMNGYIESVETLLLTMFMGGVFLLGHFYFKDEYREIEGVYIELKTIKKILKCKKEYRLWTVHYSKYSYLS